MKRKKKKQTSRVAEKANHVTKNNPCNRWKQITQVTEKQTSHVTRGKKLFL